MQPVVNEQTIYNDDSNDIPMDVNISIDDKRRIEQICSKSPFVLLSPEEKDILWKNRYVLAGDPKYLPKLLSCIDKKEVSQLREIKKLIRLTKKSTPIQAMELLSGNYLDESIREYAVNSLQQVSYMEINEYLSQLVQCLKYESYHDSPLASYLLKLAIKHPLKIGHQLFWNLKSEMHNENIRQRFGLYLEVFLLKIGHELRSVFEDETWLINKLLKLSDIGFIKDKTREEIQEILHEKLNQLNEEFSNKEISIPLNYKLKVKGLIVDKCKIMKSKKKPLWLVFKNADVYGEDIYVMFKKGDDLRQDIITLQLFRIMQNLWYSEGIKLKMSLYNVISTGYYQGMLQIVTNAETLATIQKSFGGITMGFSDKPLKYWMSKNLQGVNEVESVDNFLLSCAAYCVATFVLGIGDRHNDNIMIKNVKVQ